jgi:hypothetical protein
VQQKLIKIEIDIDFSCSNLRFDLKNNIHKKVEFDNIPATNPTQRIPNKPSYHLRINSRLDMTIKNKVFSKDVESVRQKNLICFQRKTTQEKMFSSPSLSSLFHENV